jgi:uncharacterized protein YaaR (DUF327 family)
MSVRVRGASGEDRRVGSFKDKKADRKGEVNIKHTPFLEHLISSHESVTRAELDKELGSIDEQARRLLENPVPEELVRYKELVHNFVQSTLKAAYRVRERLSGNYSIKQKVYVIVEEIDKSLAQLTREILSGQAAVFDLIARMDEIRGMLVDIYS